MLEDIQTHTTPPWAQTLSVGDIVLCRIPLFEAGDGHAPEPRPCLVADIETFHGAVCVELMPGTQAPPSEPIAVDICADATAFCGAWAAGGPWRFLARRAGMVEAAHGSFITPPHDTSPVVGRLYGSALAQLETLRGERRAARERHLAARRDRRENRRPRDRAR